MKMDSLVFLAKTRSLVREKELATKRVLARAETDLELLKAQTLLSAYRDGLIDGKNTDIRSLQKQQAMGCSATVQAAVVRIHQLEDRVDVEQIEREHQDDLISLTKAWLYTQRAE